MCYGFLGWWQNSTVVGIHEVVRSTGRYACTHTHTHNRTHTTAHTYTHTHNRTHTNTGEHICTNGRHTWAHRQTPAHTYTHAHTRRHTHAHTWTHTHEHTHAHTRTHTHTHAPLHPRLTTPHSKNRPAWQPRPQHIAGVLTGTACCRTPGVHHDPAGPVSRQFPVQVPWRVVTPVVCRNSNLHKVWVGTGDSEQEIYRITRVYVRRTFLSKNWAPKLGVHHNMGKKLWKFQSHTRKSRQKLGCVLYIFGGIRQSQWAPNGGAGGGRSSSAEIQLKPGWFWILLAYPPPRPPPQARSTNQTASGGRGGGFSVQQGNSHIWRHLAFLNPLACQLLVLCGPPTATGLQGARVPLDFSIQEGGHPYPRLSPQKFNRTPVWGSGETAEVLRTLHPLPLATHLLVKPCWRLCFLSPEENHICSNDEEDGCLQNPLFPLHLQWKPEGWRHQCDETLHVLMRVFVHAYLPQSTVLAFQDLIWGDGAVHWRVLKERLKCGHLNQSTYRQHLPKVCVQQFHSHDEDQIRIFQAFLVAFRLRAMLQEGIREVWIFRFFRSKSSNWDGKKIWDLLTQVFFCLRKYRYLVKEV